jgi:hypothetical protein
MKAAIAQDCLDCERCRQKALGSVDPTLMLSGAHLTNPDRAPRRVRPPQAINASRSSRLVLEPAAWQTSPGVVIPRLGPATGELSLDGDAPRRSRCLRGGIPNLASCHYTNQIFSM